MNSTESELVFSADSVKLNQKQKQMFRIVRVRLMIVCKLDY